MKFWWRKRINDYYYRLSKSKKIRSRSWFKIYEIDKKENLFKKGMIVLDLGSAPGSWLQYIINKINPNGILIACDILPIIPISLKHKCKIFYLKENINNKNFIFSIKKIISNKKLDIIISDISPNITGINLVDIYNYKNILDSQIIIFNKLLKVKGNFITKIFCFNELMLYKKKIKIYFKTIKMFKPISSLKKSKELYIIAKNYI